MYQKIDHLVLGFWAPRQRPGGDEAPRQGYATMYLELDSPQRRTELLPTGRPSVGAYTLSKIFKNVFLISQI